MTNVLTEQVLCARVEEIRADYAATSERLAGIAVQKREVQAAARVRALLGATG